MKKDTRSFEDVVTSIVKAEADVDRIMEAARLERNEKNEYRLTAEHKMWILGGIAGLLFFGIMVLPLILRIVIR